MMVKKKLATAVLSAFITVGLNADTTSVGTYATGMGVLENDYVKAGVNYVSGSFGSGSNTRPGLQYDSTGTGTFPANSEQGDYLTPGSPFDGFSIMIDGVNSSNNNARSTSWDDSDGLTDGENTLTWKGTNSSHSGWAIENIYFLGDTSQYIDITTNIEAGTDADDVYFSRHIDPDAMPETGDTSATDNVLGYGVIPDSNVAFSEATVSRYALGLYSTDSNVDAGISNTWTQDANGYTGSPYTDSDGNSVNYGTGDHTIGLTWHWEDVSAGDIITAEYAYIFGPSAFGAAETAIDEGAGGGADTSSWGTLTDVGSATEAAESAGSGPTVIGEATSTITRHTATETATTQTIAREKTTSTWDVYDDGSTGTAVDTVEDLTPFTGRIDQVTTANDIHNAFNHSINFDRVELINNKNDYDNGTSGDLRGFVIGGEKELANGLVVNGGFSKTSGDFTNTDKTTTSGIVVGGGVKKKLESGSVAVNVNHASTDINYTRTIGTFSNAGTTKSKDTWLNVTWVGDGEKVRPIIGVTKGKRSTDAYTETGSVQSVRTVAETKDSYTYATVGFQAEHGPFGIEALKHSNGTSNITALYNHKVDEDKNFSVGISRGTTELGESTSIVTGFIWRF